MNAHLLALLLLPFLQADRKQEKPAPDLRNEKYGPHERNVLDLWKAKAETPTPLVVFIHGGGFRAGSKEAVSGGLVKKCLESGISVAAINYRLSQHAPFPAAMHDSGRALQHLRSKAKEWNLDPDRFAATGGSAGGGISLWLAFHDDLADPKSDDPIARLSTRVRCVVGTGAQCSYDPRWIKEHIGGRAHEHPALLPFYGLKAEELETEKAYALFREASALTHLTKDDPPVYLYYNGRDKPGDKPGAGIHSEKFGTALQEEMKKLGLVCEVKVGSQSLDEEIAFFVKHLK